MIDHFNKLNPAQHELLTKIMEESAEVIQSIGKIFCHGLNSTEPGCALENQEKLQNEIGDLWFFIDLAAKHRAIDMNEIRKAYTRRSKRVNQYLHHVEVD